MSLSILRTQENGVEYFTVVETGESGLSQRGLARACGKRISTIQALIKNLTDGKAPKRLERFIGKDLTLTDEAVKNGQKVTVYKSAFCSAVIKHYAYLGSETAQDIDDAIGEIGLNSYIQGKTGWLSSQQQSSVNARNAISRIVEAPNPWKRLYEKEACEKAFSWFGANFYWEYCYHWMTEEERAKLNAVNPPINGERKHRIHQYIEKEARERLTPKMQELCVLVDVCASRNEFITKYMRRYGLNQLELFDMN
jgi:hypothetical protein